MLSIARCNHIRGRNLPWYQPGFSIDGIDFYYVHNDRLPFVWKDGQIYDGGKLAPAPYSGLGLEEAYELELLTRDDLREIADRIRVIYETGGNE